jgi:FKBP12-rapamycin complex-associated protein
MSTRYNPSLYKAWHTWALANFDVVNYLDPHSESRQPDDAASDSLADHVVGAIRGMKYARRLAA